MTSDKRRKTITIKLTPGKDNDLISWWESLERADHTAENGGRQHAAKSALRSGLGLPMPAPTSRADLERLQDEIDTFRAALAKVPMLVQTAKDNDREELERDIQASFNAVRTEFEEIRAMIDAIAAGGVAGRAALVDVPIEPTPQLTDQELSQRKNKLKKATW